jgi:hypothetical protein
MTVDDSETEEAGGAEEELGTSLVLDVVVRWRVWWNSSVGAAA